jgi:hypothetical protein
VILGGLLLPALAAGAKLPEGLRITGELPQPSINEGNEGRIIQMDSAHRKMYYAYRNHGDGDVPHIVEYDLRKAIPSPVREATLPNADIAGAGPYSVSLDSRRNRLLYLIPSQVGQNKIGVYDLKRFKEAATWDLESTIPGFVPFGMSFSKADDRLYLVGEFSQAAVLSGLGKPLGPGTSVIALDPSDGKLVWDRPVPKCQHALTTYHVGALITQSELTRAVYFACVTRGSGAGDTYPGQAGVVRLWVSRKADQESANTFNVDFFPISGSYYSNNGSGIAVFDHETDRFFLQSLSTTTPGVWVFDGRVSAWVGFIGAPDPTDFWAGIDPASGHFFIGGEGGVDQKKVPGYLLVSDGRATPVPQGGQFPIKVDGFIATDPATRRLFIPTEMGVPDSVSNYVRIIIAVDQTPDARPERPPRYDDLTSDIPEGGNALSDFSGGANGYGARAVVVGGYRAALGYAGQGVAADQVTQGRVRSGDRGITAARVSSVDFRKVGASAAAQSLVRDTNTEGEMTENAPLDWPWQPAACLDGAGEQVSDDKSAQGDAAIVTCDLAKETAQAESTFGAVKAGPISIGSSAFQARAYRDAERGLITEAIAGAQGIHIAIPSGGTISIADVESVATTVAHGRPGTTKASWTRTISGIVQRDEKGKVVQRFGECTSSSKQDTCGDLFAQINKALGVKLELKLPEPDLIETPKGAFAGVQQSDADFLQGRTVLNQGAAFAAEAESRAVPALQIVVYNDSVERSRLLVQLAALQANSIYTISAPPPAPRTPTATQNKTGDGTTQSTPSGSLGSGSGAIDPIPLSSGDDISPPPYTDSPVLATPADQVVQGLRFLVRSPGEALLLGSVWLLFGSAGFAIFRRRMLLEVLGR